MVVLLGTGHVRPISGSVGGSGEHAWKTNKGEQMPKYIVNVDLDSPREEGEHIEKKFEKGIEAPDEHAAELVVDKFIKEQMYGGPYYSIEEADDEA